MSLLLASFTLGIGMSAIGFLRGLVPIALVLTVLGFIGGYAEVNLAAWFQEHVERTLLGRVMSVMMFSAVVLIPVSLVLAGAITQISVRAMFITSGALIVVVAAIATGSPDVRSID
jgi:hypothetical protein